ncbi:type II secretion system F family protein [Paeniglutamicibacter psychrophenolicus]|uniref:type II secretion system F family protein n=1 Tax=Paeniglutamicibacter psychrophenolicus TaxID=257454 RepID=UPI0027824B04|nr:type II secretion system F family protein [Paeniglutamicibacter psychrophenolicus]MDQ0095515.1 tight adherence protein B [Paeniglutamicibacter psychrophenolicus]
MSAALAALAVLLAGAAAWLWPGGGNAGGRRLPMPPGHPGSRPHDASALRPSRRTLRIRSERTNHAADTEEYAKFLRQLAALLRAGTGPAAAFGLLAELWAQGSTRTAIDLCSGASRALAQVHTGGTLQQGLAAHAATHPGNRRLWTRLAWCLAICEESGAALAELLDTLAEDAETAADMHRALDSALAGPRATGRLLTFLPGIGLGLGQLLGINPLAVLTTHPAGRIALVAGACLWLGNRLWCGRMLRAIANKVPS